MYVMKWLYELGYFILNSIVTQNNEKEIKYLEKNHKRFRIFVSFKIFGVLQNGYLSFWKT